MNESIIDATNEPLMHAMIALAARCAECDLRPTVHVIRAIAQELAREHCLDSRDRKALLDAAESFTTPLVRAAATIRDRSIVEIYDFGWHSDGPQPIVSSGLVSPVPITTPSEAGWSALTTRPGRTGYWAIGAVVAVIAVASTIYAVTRGPEQTASAIGSGGTEPAPPTKPAGRTEPAASTPRRAVTPVAAVDPAPTPPPTAERSAVAVVPAHEASELPKAVAVKSKRVRPLIKPPTHVEKTAPPNPTPLTPPPEVSQRCTRSSFASVLQAEQPNEATMQAALARLKKCQKDLGADVYADLQRQLISKLLS